METSKQYARIERLLVFLLAADYLSTKSFTLQTDVQEDDNNTVERGAERPGLDLCKEWIDKLRG